jgi:hypothetical protein
MLKHDLERLVSLHQQEIDILGPHETETQDMLGLRIMHVVLGKGQHPI